VTAGYPGFGAVTRRLWWVFTGAARGEFLPRHRKSRLSRSHRVFNCSMKAMNSGWRLHRFCRRAALLNAVDGGDVGMVQRAEHARFAFEARQPVGIGGKCRRQNLDRDPSRVARPIDFTHLAGTSSQRRPSHGTFVSQRFPLISPRGNTSLSRATAGHDAPLLSKCIIERLAVRNILTSNGA
jgi:hypothetical protein